MQRIFLVLLLSVLLASCRHEANESRVVAEAAGELFSISPNPATKNLQITISQEGSYTMEIYSANGVMLKQESIANMSTIDVSELLAGSYVIKIYNDNFSGVRTFVKK